MIARILHFFRHDWRDDTRQTKRYRYQHCARCSAHRAVERESFSQSRPPQ